ncbi:cytidylyltransferase domain-containing protein [Bordetella petrii]|uniref:cytidylyltransferase domain-containing protein n=1 Tax=Bordetella petrii TaxID=94624 RepID=UPI00047BCA47|nr:hypothetical protein [Bordetella petrii]
MSVLVVIPARGGSKGIPRKSIRPVAGKPMISYAIRAALAAQGVDRVAVSTDDEEIALLSQRFGAEVLMRDASLAADQVTLDPVVVSAATQAERRYGQQYDIVITVQPTSPLVQATDIERALALFSAHPDADTVLSVVDDRHLRWTLRDGQPVPDYAARVNRQQLPPSFRETGAIIACRRGQLQAGTRIGARIQLLEMPAERSFDIDSVADLFLCESLLARKRIVFAVVGYPAVGLGHAYRAAMLAHEMVRHELHFVCDAGSELAADYLRQFNYAVTIAPAGGLLDTIAGLQPHLVVNDILDTEADYIDGLHALGCKVVNFEDLGPGHERADLVFNALYPGRSSLPQVRCGAEYFCLRDEFLYAPHMPVHDNVARVLVTFGGVDEGNLTARVLDLVAPVCQARGIALDVVLGPGYAHQDDLRAVLARHVDARIAVTQSTKRISDHMARADVAITSGGRTVFELASLGVPTLVVCQNRRETTHTFAGSEHGVMNLGFRGDVTDAQLSQAFATLLADAALRRDMRARMQALDLSQGKARVINQMLALLD